MLSRILSLRTTGVVRTVLSFLSLTIAFSFLLCLSSRPAEARPVVTFEGFHDGADCASIFGWAWNSAQPNATISVDVYADNVLIATAPADLFRQDLFNAGKGNGAHGFNIPTPVNLIDGQPHSIRVKISSSNIDLFNTPKTINCILYDGFLDAANCAVISGWALNSTQPSTPINVDFFIDNDAFPSIRVLANQFRQDLANAGKGDGFHAFNFATPSFLKDGNPHAIHAKFTGTSLELTKSPRTINCGPNVPPAFEGYHDAQDCNFISGWAWDANMPDTTVSVDIYVDNVFSATVAADQFRQDLLNAGKGNGNHAFAFPTPASIKDGNTHTVSIGFHLTDIPLTNTPRMINCP